ncbi:FdhF/YdeP family oxidoreductase [Actinomadura rupiterrae]|uniref:FdhF/YdeP family oxidoreductase n=1 Tax=Actinomadura rupiterrae TaxID=559627 RepID=UPI0020A4C9DE|nr:FdhF/YdeP family oxidoreductase [Actinomadura rupiterrae]MCP2341398.1 molybdopterin-dependent oxidoreductase alpha subunit [Actinomadura rupiterrae]
MATDEQEQRHENDTGIRQRETDAETRPLPPVGAPPKGRPTSEPYTHPAAGWGAAMAVSKVLFTEREVLRGAREMFKMNHEDGGFDCPGCAWPDTKDLTLDLCENGIKHTAWEMTGKRVTRDFFARHTVSELSEWPDYALEDQGRLTEPMVYDRATDRYVPISWDDAFQKFGEAIRAMEHPDQSVFYTSGRLGNEASFLLQLMSREIGTNNQPDCANMCTEAGSRALHASLGTGKGTVDLKDWESADAVFVLGINAASNAPRMLTTLAQLHRGGKQIVHINPLVEAGATRTIIPHDFVAMGTFHATGTSTLNIQPRAAGDMALMRGIAKATLERAATDEHAIDRQFLERYTTGFEEYRAVVEQTSWDEIVRQSGVGRPAILKAAGIYRDADRTIITWGLGVNQHEHAVDTIREIVNVLLLRGNIGREGAGPAPNRGHSNVQGNRTCGIDNAPTPEFLDRLAEVCGIDPPREPGLDTVGTIEAMHRGDIRVFLSMGGNFARSAPDPRYTHAGLRKVGLTVQVSTKLNRSHLVHGRDALILPCLGRTETDMQKNGKQRISVEDGMSMVHLSQGNRPPASPQLRSEPAIIAGLARAALPESTTPWQWYTEDYDRIRDTMAKALVGFEDFNRRVRLPMGFRLKQPARELVFLTPSGRAEFSRAALPDVVPADGRLVLGAMRSHDQWNTTIYSDNDRYRGISNLRTLVFMNPGDMAARGLDQFAPTAITAFAKDGTERTLRGFLAVAHDMPAGVAAGYMPELNELIGISDRSAQSAQPLMKQLSVTIERLPG